MKKYVIAFTAEDGNRYYWSHNKKGYYSSVGAARKGLSRYRCYYYYFSEFLNRAEGLLNPETAEIIELNMVRTELK